MGRLHTYTKPRRSKLSPQDVQDIRDRYRAGETQKDLAAEYGVAPSAISYRCQGIDRALQPCGTRAAYQRHRFYDETPCQACTQANAEASAEYVSIRRGKADG